MFDLDGTLLDSAPDLAAAWMPCLNAWAARPGLDKVRLWIGKWRPVLVRRALADDMRHDAVDDAAADEALALFMALYGAVTP